ncbi:putative XRE-type DNA-binding protein [Nocardia transvalensis]|uniref:Putative XRE-type DNA-binding protein n=1 Tax=Nocardia transvalensis TaxID=37333 RepID=A0A7W9PDF1_9NOCA|nr:helix-turn-helix domain-containing protein [Nocardia transvalensis]MBB5913598.1 putative XRE-type DNA-binding protein [Nocardia transvalensis]
MSGKSFVPIAVPASVWDRGEVRTALRERDIAALLRSVQQYTGASQQRIATALEMSQGRVNELINRRRIVTSLGAFERIADGLRMPDHARMDLGLAPAASEHVTLSELAEISATYPSQSAAADEIRKIAKDVASVDILAVRGLGILGLNDSLLREALPLEARLRVLLLDPDSDAAADRAAEIGESPESFVAGIRLSIARVKEMAAANRPVQIYLYSHAPVWRIIKLDSSLFVSAFTDYHEGHSSPTHRVEPNRHGVLHHAFVRTLEQNFATGCRII